MMMQKKKTENPITNGNITTTHDETVILDTDMIFPDVSY